MVDIQNLKREMALRLYSKCPLLEYSWICLSLTENTRSRPYNADWNITQLSSVWDQIKRGNHFRIWIAAVVKGSEMSLLILLHGVRFFSEICFVETIGKLDAYKRKGKLQADGERIRTHTHTHAHTQKYTNKRIPTYIQIDRYCYPPNKTPKSRLM